MIKYFPCQVKDRIVKIGYKSMKRFCVCIFFIFLLGCNFEKGKDFNMKNGKTNLSETEVVKIALQEIEQRYSDYDKYKPYKADFADGNWMVSGTLPAGIKGGTPYVIIRDRDKKILDVNRFK